MKEKTRHRLLQLNFHTRWSSDPVQCSAGYKWVPVRTVHNTRVLSTALRKYVMTGDSCPWTYIARILRCCKIFTYVHVVPFVLAHRTNTAWPRFHFNFSSIRQLFWIVPLTMSLKVIRRERSNAICAKDKKRVRFKDEDGVGIYTLNTKLNAEHAVY